MPIPITYYKCAVCGKLYDEFKKAKDCEDKENKCLSCDNAYYVYGCEFNCQFSLECNYLNKFPFFIPKKNIEGEK